MAVPRTGPSEGRRRDIDKQKHIRPLSVVCWQLDQHWSAAGWARPQDPGRGPYLSAGLRTRHRGIGPSARPQDAGNGWL